MTGQVAAPVAPATVPGNGDTGGGFLVGVTPAQPQQQVDWDGASAPTGSPQAQAVIAPPAVPAPGTTVYTEEDINRVRQEEKQKLYDRLQEQEARLKAIEAEKEAREAAEKEAREAAEAEAKKAEEEKMSAKQLVEQVRQETAASIASIQAERDQERAIFEKERQFAELERYQTAQIAQNASEIMPELRDLIHGSTQQEIDASIEAAKVKTQQIMGRTQQQAVQTHQSMQGVSPTGAAPVGPMEQQTSTQTFTQADIAGMSMDEWKANRHRLLPAAGQAYRQGF